MRDFEFFLEKLSQLGRAEITCYAYGQFWDLHTSLHPNPLRLNIALREKLVEMMLNAPQLPVAPDNLITQPDSQLSRTEMKTTSQREYTGQTVSSP